MLIQPQDVSFGTFFDLLTGYRSSLLMMEIAKSGLADFIGQEGKKYHDTIASLDWNENAGKRFIDVLCSLGFLLKRDDMLFLAPFSQIYLSKDSPSNQRETLAFEETLLQNWQQLGDVLKTGEKPAAPDKSPEEYNGALNRFLKAMNEAARFRAEELWSLFTPKKQGVILEIGAGSGAYLADFLEKNPQWKGVFCDLPDVVEIAQKDERLKALLERITFIPCNLLEPELIFTEELKSSVDILLLSNFVHCQSQPETAGILERLLPVLHEEGVVVIHDFFKDVSYQGARYDLHMMLNTYNGGTYETAEIASLLKASGFPFCSVKALPSYSAALFGSRHASALPVTEPFHPLKNKARQLGFFQVVPVSPGEIPVAQWVREKCRTGCPGYDKQGACPPRSPSLEETRQLFSEYKKAFLLVGEPPLKEYHENLLELEKFAFCEGFHKALAMAGGPCPLCEECQPDHCRFPAKRRYSLEACGCDVFGLAKKTGIILTPLKQNTDFVQYISMLLIE